MEEDEIVPKICFRQMINGIEKRRAPRESSNLCGDT